ncbi:MAG: signal peptidase I [Candidatus Methanoperedens sp.]|nr:signal peptidase I [Candidatus Methanoperedens sp.]
MFLPLLSILVIASLFISLIILRKSILNNDFFNPVKRYSLSYHRKSSINNYIRDISKQPQDSQKMILKEVMIFSIFSLIMLIIASKSIFFTAVVSGSMVPTFERNDLILMQNIGKSYNIGDIVMFIDPYTSRPVTHRIAKIGDDGMIRTAGDFSGLMDGWKITKENILAKAITINGKPIVIKRYGRFFIVDAKDQQLALFGNDYRSYFLFFQVIKIYGYVIIVLCIILYITLSFKKKPWQNR